MNADINYGLILGMAVLTILSPGPANLAIAGTSLASGRRFGLALASGVTTGSWMWSMAAAAGLSAVMQANAWAFEVIRYLGAAYLMFLGYKSAKSALTPGDLATRSLENSSVARAWRKGLMLHMVNPKAILFFGSVYSLGVPPDASAFDLFTVFAMVGVISLVSFHSWAIIFSSPAMVRSYMRARRWFEGVFALAFGAASIRVLTAKLL